MPEPHHLHRHVTVFTSEMYQMNSVVFLTAQEVFIVDPGVLPSEVELIRRHVEDVRRHRRLNVIYTHGDYDHIMGHTAFPNTRVIASRQFSDPAIAHKNLAAARKWDMLHYVNRELPAGWPAVDIPIKSDGKSMHFSGSVLTFYLAPGHTADGLIIVLDPAGILVAGDYLSDLEVPFIEHSLLHYRRTLLKMSRIVRSHSIHHMVPGHGSPASDQGEISRRVDLGLAYLDDLERAIMGAIEFPVQKWKSLYRFWAGFEQVHREQFDRLKSKIRTKESTD